MISQWKVVRSCIGLHTVCGLSGARFTLSREQPAQGHKAGYGEEREIEKAWVEQGSDCWSTEQSSLAEAFPPLRRSRIKTQKVKPGKDQKRPEEHKERAKDEKGLTSQKGGSKNLWIWRRSWGWGGRCCKCHSCSILRTMEEDNPKETSQMGAAQENWWGPRWQDLLLLELLTWF